MPRSDTSTFDFRRAAALQFADRPTLRQVVSEQLLKLMLAELPWLASVHPALPCADVLTLDSPDPASTYWTTQPLVDRVLQAMLERNPIDLEPIAGRHHNLGVLDPYRFAGANSPFATRQLSGLTDPVNELIAQLPQHFCQAQLDYWRAQGSAGVSRDEWLQLLLKTALLRGLPLQGLDSQEQACLRGLIRGGADQPPVSFVQARLVSGVEPADEMLCHLLVSAEWDERQVVLWCAPSGNVSRFASLAAFAVGLRDELAQRYSFNGMSWQRYPVEGNVFAQQAALLHEAMCDRVHRVRYGRIADIAALERLFTQLSDPAQWFGSYLDESAAVSPPPGLLASTGSDSFAYQAGLLQLAADQLDAEGVAALEGVQSLADYTREQLAEPLRKVTGSDLCADELVLEFFVAQGMPGGAATGAGGGEPLVFEGQKTLTEFAIGSLGELRNATIRRIRRRDGADLPLGLSVGAVNQMVSQIDVGGRYPLYVARKLDDPQQRPQRIRRFAREWRSAMRFSALHAKLDGKLSEAGLQCVNDFCAGHDNPLAPRMMLMPLTFKRQPDSHQQDTVRGMYLLFCAEPALVLLYRPLYAQDTLREYASFDALLEHIQESVRLQSSILDWLDPFVRPIYDNGGFREPHVGSLGVDPYDLPEKPLPPVIDPPFWRSGLDDKLYDANRDLLVELADLHSTSNAERRWQALAQGAWLLFDTVSLVLSGPIAAVAWLVQLLGALEDDLLAIEQGGAFERCAAVADLIVNLSMMLLHARQPPLTPGPVAEPPEAGLFEGPAAQRGAFGEVSVLPTGGEEAALGTLAMLPERRLDLSWRGNHGFNWLPPAQRQALRAMRSGIALEESMLQADGAAQGLYQVDDRFYAAMGADVYPVQVLPEGVRVIDGHGGYGPWLSFARGAWRVDTSLRLAGGMRQAGTRASLVARLNKLEKAADALTRQANAASERFTMAGADVTQLREKITRLEDLRAREQAKLDNGMDDTQRTTSTALIDRYDTRIAEWRTELSTKREEAVRDLEAAVRCDNEVLVKYQAILEPKFASVRPAMAEQALPERVNVIRTALIRNNDFIYSELLNLADYPGLAELQQALHGRSVRERLETYRAFRLKLQGVVDRQERMLAAYEYLDQLLTDAPLDLLISHPDTTPRRTVASLIAERELSTVQLRFHQVMNLADLALHLDSSTGQETLRGFRDELMSFGLRSAAGAHGDLGFARLPLDDRITVLQEAWDEYAAALVNSARIRDQGGALVEVSMLDRYRTHLEKLKLDAGRRLVDAMKEQEGASVTPGRVPYAIANMPQRAVRNSEGQLLIGNEVVVNGQPMVEVREPFTKEILTRFEQRDGRWVEQVSEPAPVDAGQVPADTAFRVQALQDEARALSQKADEYVSYDLNGMKIRRMFERLINKLGREAASLTEEGAAAGLIRIVENAADQLRSDMNYKLTKLYTDTKYPTAEGLQFLHEQKLIRVEYVSPRKTMANGSAFDEYKVLRLTGATGGRPLWVAHFHLPTLDANAQDFTQGHLKTWSQRRMSGREEAALGQRVHRGKLTLEQARGIIPFD